MICNAIDLIKDHEGYREAVYNDSLGYPTGGYGHAFLPGSKLPGHIWELILIDDLAEAGQNFKQLGLDLDDVRRAACLDLLFNLGLTKLLKFKTFIKHMRAGDYDAAAAALENSLWYQQVARRGPRICALIRTGQWEAIT